MHRCDGPRLRRLRGLSQSDNRTFVRLSNHLFPAIYTIAQERYAKAQVASAWLTNPFTTTPTAANAVGTNRAVSTCSKFHPNPSSVAPLQAPRIAPKRPIPSIQETPVARPWVG